MDDLRFGATIRAIRIRRRLTQKQLGALGEMSDAQVSRIERGHLDGVPLATLRRVAAALDVRVDIVARWRGGDLDRLLNARHSALHDDIARWFQHRLPTWILAPEASFAIGGERGVIDVLAFHPDRRAVLVIELKTEIVDINELLGTLDRKRRLAPRIARERRWPADTVGTILVVSETRTNRRRLAAHASVLRAALPTNHQAARAWLRDPLGRCDGIVVWPEPGGASNRGTKRVRARAGEKPGSSR